MASNYQERGRQTRSISRRRFLHGMLGGAGTAIAAQLLAACGGGGPTDTPTVEPAGTTSAPAANAPIGAATTLTLMMGEGEFSNDQIKAFTDANPSIKVERVPDDDSQF